MTERAIDFAKRVRMGVYQQTSFDSPPTIYAHGPGLKEPLRLPIHT